MNNRQWSITSAPATGAANRRPLTFDAAASVGAAGFGWERFLEREVPYPPFHPTVNRRGVTHDGSMTATRRRP